MPSVLQFRRGTTAQNNSFTGAAGEISVDTDVKTLRVHDGSTAGGSAVVSESGTQTLTNKTLTSPTITGVSPTITLGGDLSGSLTLTNLGGGTLTATIAANSVALGTDTTGNYVATGATSGNGISGSVSSEGGTFTVTSNATNANTANTIVYRDASGNFSAGTITAALSGNASTATALQTARTIGGVSFDGTANINLPGVNTAGNQDTSGTATNATNFNVAADNTTNAAHYVIFTGGASGNQRPNSDTGLTYNPSTNTLATTNFDGQSTTAKYADLAENYLADGVYAIGTVLQIGGDAEVTVANNTSHAIVGTVSENPGYLMNSALEGEFVTPVAYIGRVPCRVIGTVNRGDLLAVSDIPGVAVAKTPGEIQTGQLVGKALENHSDDDYSNEGLIEILVGRL